MAKWVGPTRASVEALWLLIRDGKFRTSNGVPKFQLARGVKDPDELYVSWPYDNDSVVRCPIDDIPAYLPDEAPDRVNKILRFIAKRDLRPPTPIDRSHLTNGTSQQLADAAESLFTDALSQTSLDDGSRSVAIDAFRETLQGMIGRKMIKGA
ncbi:MAG: hypothetical protein ACE5F9_09720 [Phycisphaerae bacterium]